MLKYISTVILVLATIAGKAQVFSYSENYLSYSTPSKIIGQVKDNIIVWYKGAENNKRSVILIYDNRFKLIKKVTTDILHSDIDPAASFYNSVDSFYVAYQYKKGNKWEYRLSGFDDNGELSSTYIIDSLSNSNTDESFSFDYCQSADKKVLCCTKAIINKRYNAIRFEFTSLSHGNLYRDNLFLAFDGAHEKFVDFSIDSNKNVTLLKTSDTDSGFNISVIKKEFYADYFLIAVKKLDAGNLRNGTSHLFNKSNSYTVYGVWENTSRDLIKGNQKYKTGLYTWNIDGKLVDIPGDTILYDDSTIISQFNLYANNASGNKPDNFFGIQTDSINIPDPSAFPETGQLVYQSNGKTGYYNYIPYTPSEQTPSPSHYKAGFTVVSLNNYSKIEWRNELKNNADNTSLIDLSNNKIVAGKKGIHIVRSISLNETRSTIEHTLITYSGRHEKVNTVAWSNKYNYLLSKAVETNNGALIIPCLKDHKLLFTKMVLE